MRLRSILKSTVHILYGIIAVGILFSTLLLDKNIVENKFPNEARWANWRYYLIALFLLALLILVRCIRKGGVSRKGFFTALTVIGLVTLAIQAAVAAWAPEITESDFGKIREAAIMLASDGDFTWELYFEYYPNQVNLTILFSWLYRLTGSWRAVIMIGAVLTNLSIILMSLIVYSATDDGAAALLACLCGEAIVALSWRAFMPYTDNWGMPFVIGIVLLVLSDIRWEYKLPLGICVALAGTWIKATVLIAALAALFFVPIGRKSPKPEKPGEKRVGRILRGVLSLTLSAALAVGGLYIFPAAQKACHYEQTENSKSWQYWFLLGQNEDNTGQIGSKEFYDEWQTILITNPERKARLDECARKAAEKIAGRGVEGNIEFYTKVLGVCFNDGRFHNVQPYDHESAEHGAVYDLYANDGRFYPNVTDGLQVLWDAVLILMTLGFAVSLSAGKKNDKQVYFEILLIGIVLYLFLFENRSKYLYMFLPALIGHAGLILSSVSQSALEARQKRSKAPQGA